MSRFGKATRSVLHCVLSVYARKVAHMTTAVISGGKVPVWNQADRLVKSRGEGGLSQSELADLIEVSRRTITSYENGTRTPKRPVLIAWALATGVDVDWLINGDQQEPSDPDGVGAPSRTRTYDLRIKRSPVRTLRPNLGVAA